MGLIILKVFVGFHVGIVGRHAKTHAIRVILTQIRCFLYTHACGPIHSLKFSF